MAKAAFPFSNGIGDYSMFKMFGTNKVTIRGKGGATQKQIQTLPQFKRTRQLNTEFSASSKAASKLHRAVFGVTQLADFGLMAAFTRITNFIQHQDTTSSVGARQIIFS